jgi:DNA (cytosine-5)-methyltransferase 1
MDGAPPATHLYNEIDPYRAAVLRARISEGRLPHGIVDTRDICTIPDEEFAGYDQVHLFAGIGGFPLGLRLAGIPERGLRIVTGGFPCQDISNAGRRAGISGARSGLWREMLRCIRVVQPELAFVENVAALLGRGMERVLGDLAEIGYDARWNRVSAADAGAPHLRERIWIMAYPANANDGSGYARTCERQESESGNGGCAPDVADTERYGRQQVSEILCARESVASPRGEALADASQPGLSQPERATVLATRRGNEGRAIAERDWWATEPDVGRMAHGIPARVDRLAALGDAIVPQACAQAIRQLLGAR